MRVFILLPEKYLDIFLTLCDNNKQRFGDAAYCTKQGRLYSKEGNNS